MIPILSVALNLVLLGAILFTLQRPAERVSLPAPNKMATGATQVIKIVSETNSLPPMTSLPFDWSQMEAEDFSIYAQNLRGIGCPESTVRDILTAEIEQYFVQRRQALFRPFQNRFWDLMAQGNSDLVDESSQEELDALGEQKKDLFKKVFPNGLATEDSRPDSEYESILGDELSPEKIQQLRAIVQQITKLKDELAHEPAKSEKRTAIVNASKDLLAQQERLLSPEELQEFKLRKSQFAQQMSGMIGFEASEEELRSLARLHLDAKPADHSKMEQQVKSLLGEKRFGEFTRSTNSSFHSLNQLARRYDLSKETVAEVYDLVRETSREVEEIEKGTGLSVEVREATLQSIREQTQAALVSKLGVGAAETYRRISADWDKVARP